MAEVDPQQQAFAAAALVQGLQADAPIGFAVHDEELRFELLSHSLAAIYGRPPQEHLGRRITQILPGGPAGEIEGLLAVVRDTGVARTGVEVDATTAAEPGELRTWVATLYPLDIEGRRLVGVVLVDVTERRRAQEALQESERVLSGAQRMAGLGWWRWTAAPESAVYAPELLALMGLDPALGGTPQAPDLVELIDPEERRSFRAEGFAAVRDGRSLARRLRARRADGDIRTLDVRADPVAGPDGEPDGLQGFVQDITELERAARRQRIVAELGQEALAGAPLDALIEHALAAVERGVEVDGAAVLELLPSGDELEVRAAHAPPGHEGPVRIPIPPGGPQDRALRAGHPVVIGDWEQERTGDREAALAARLRSAITVVIGGRGRPFGLLTAVSRHPHRFAPEDTSFLQAITNTLADAVERRLAEAEIEELSATRGRLVGQALDAEARARRSIAESLHDGALQDLLAAGHDLYALAGRGGDEEALRRAHEDLNAVIRSLREVMSALHPTVLQYAGLEAAVAAVADQQGGRGGFLPDVGVDPDAAGTHDELLLSVARELLSNAARHARAANVTVRVSREGDRVVLEVADDGAGLAPERLAEARAEGRIGLASCLERMEAVGGTLRVEGSSGSGTRVRAEAPVSVGREPGLKDGISSLDHRPDGE
jgi:signal transduction histidine kinase/PAS domain-containing protein